MQRLMVMLIKREQKVKRRIDTKVPRRAKEKRLTNKKLVAEKKKLRTTVD
jgi:hypothetical protein